MASAPVVSIDVYGDGSMMGITSVTDFSTVITPNTEPLQDQGILQAQFQDSGVTLVNHATGGGASSLMDLLAGDDGGGPPYAQRIAASTAFAVLDNHGANDGLGGESLPDYQGDLVTWIQQTRAAGKIPILEEPGPVCDGNHPALGDFVQAMDAAAQTYGVTLITQYNAILAIPNWQAHMDATCFYPDDFLTSFKAQREAAVLAPLVKTALGE